MKQIRKKTIFVLMITSLLCFSTVNIEAGGRCKILADLFSMVMEALKKSTKASEKYVNKATISAKKYGNKAVHSINDDTRTHTVIIRSVQATMLCPICHGKGEVPSYKSGKHKCTRCHGLGFINRNSR